MNPKLLATVDQHWAVQATGLSPNEAKTLGAKALSLLSLSYEIAAIECIEADTKEMQKLHQAAAWRAFELRSLLPLPSEDVTRMFCVFHLTSLACCAGHWQGLRRWIKSNNEAVSVPIIAGTEWDAYLLSQMFNIWIRLASSRCQPNTGYDANYITELCRQLRMEQGIYEESYLARAADKHTTALQLIALYFAIDGLSSIVQQDSANAKLVTAAKSAAASGDIPLEMLLVWLRAAAKAL